MTIRGVEQVVLMGGEGATSVSPTDGALLWQHTWDGGARIVQPGVIADGHLLMSSGEGQGIRRVEIESGPEGWMTKERWTSNRLKPYFNDFVVHEGHAYGFDGRIMTCIDVEEGQRQWKGGRYGHGQLILLPDQDLLLVTTEDGELALVSASPEEFTEIARIPALEGKTWNHPALVGDVLLVRNGEEMAAFHLTLETT